jgi:hypothetical protein
VAEPDFNVRNDTPVTRELLESLAADYTAGLLPDDIKERIEALRDEYYDSLRDRSADLAGDLKPGIEEFTRSVLAQQAEIEAGGATLNSEEFDSRAVPMFVNVADQLADKVVEPVLDAVEDVVHGVFDFARDLVDLRIEHDPGGRYADKLAASQEELSRAGEQFDADMDGLHVKLDTSREALGQLRDEADEFHEGHAPIRILNSTTVDPSLPQQMADDTGEGVA